MIDTTPEFRLQMLRADVRAIDAVLLTHHHADHVNGFDDLRQFTLGSPKRIPVYAPPETTAWVRQHFSYIWQPRQLGGGVPQVDLFSVEERFTVAGVTVTPIPVEHGHMIIHGYRIGNIAYISDVSRIPESSMGLLKGLDVLFLDAVRYRPHSTHFHLASAMETARVIGAKTTYFTHLNHDFVHSRLATELPQGMLPAYDGLVVRSESCQDHEDRT